MTVSDISHATSLAQLEPRRPAGSDAALPVLPPTRRCCQAGCGALNAQVEKCLLCSHVICCDCVFSSIEAFAR
jgi:hypothetical protein